MSDIAAILFVLLQRVLPRNLLTSIVYRLAHIRSVAFKNFLIRHFVKFYDVDVENVLLPIPDGFDSFNAFFVRELNDNARIVEQSRHAIVSPVDGTVSAAGKLDKDRIIQAKGIDYSLTELLATDTEETQIYIDGAFATIYLAPYNYHRVHAPLAGELVAARYVPGDLYSVNEVTVARLPALFVRNERLVCHFITDSGPMVLIFVGAMNVGSINTEWTGEIRPQKTGVVSQINIRDAGRDLQFRKGDLLGWFNMGSTVILLHPPDSTNDFEGLVSGKKVQMGQSIGWTNPVK